MPGERSRRAMSRRSAPPRQLAIAGCINDGTENRTRGKYQGEPRYRRAAERQQGFAFGYDCRNRSDRDGEARRRHDQRKRAWQQPEHRVAEKCAPDPTATMAAMRSGPSSGWTNSWKVTSGVSGFSGASPRYRLRKAADRNRYRRQSHGVPGRSAGLRGAMPTHRT